MIKRQQTSTRMSQIVEYPSSSSVVILAGQVADDRTGDVSTQTADVLSKIDQLLAQAGAEKTKIVSAYVWLRDIADFEAMNLVWDKWVAPGHAPARACVEAKLADPSLRVEIQVIAVK